MKEIDYEVWYEYLIESKEYRDVCLIKSKGKHVSKNQFYLGLTYDFFGDVFKTPFEQWWQSKQDPFSAIGTIEYSKQQAAHEFDAAVDSLRISLKREPTLDEFKEAFMRQMFNHLPGCFTVRVYLHPKMKPDDFKLQFGQILTEKRKTFQEWENDLAKGWLTQGKKTYSQQLLRYLVVKRLEEKGLKFETIAAVINAKNSKEIRSQLIQENRFNNSGERFTEKDVETISNILQLKSNRKREPYGEPRREDSQKARIILNNIKLGMFPGEYYPEVSQKIRRKRKSKKIVS